MKRIVAISCAVLLVALALAACGKEYVPEQLSKDEVSMVSASVTDTNSLYVVEEKTAVDELVDLYNGLHFTDLNGTDPEMMERKVYVLNYFGADGSQIASCYISPDGYIKMSNSLNVTYKLIGRLDEDSLVNLLEENNKYK